MENAWSTMLKSRKGLLKSRAGFLGTAVPKRGTLSERQVIPHFLSSLPPKAGKTCTLRAVAIHYGMM